MGLFGGFKANFTNRIRRKKKDDNVVCLKYVVHSEFDDVKCTPVEERVTKPRRPIIKSLYVEDNRDETNLERSQSLNPVNANRWEDGEIGYSLQRNDKHRYEESIEHSRTPERLISSESNETTNQNLQSQNLEQTATNDVYINSRKHSLNLKDYELIQNNTNDDYDQIRPVEEYKIHGSNNRDPLIFRTQSSSEQRKKNVENGEDNFETHMPPVTFSEQHEENTPNTKFKIKDTEEQFRVHFVQIDSYNEYPVSEEELFGDEEDISEYKDVGYSSQAASIFFGEDELPKLNRPRRIVFSTNGDGPAEDDC